MKKTVILAAALAGVFLLAGLALASHHLAPSLVGTWEGASTMHNKAVGFAANQVKYVIENQQGRVFHGYIELIRAHNKAQHKEAFSGVIAKDNQTIYMAHHAEGIIIGHLDAKDEMTLYYLEPGTQAAMAVILELKRK